MYCDGEKFEVDCECDVYLREVILQITFERTYVYSLFNSKYYLSALRIDKTDIRSGDVLFV